MMRKEAINIEYWGITLNMQWSFKINIFYKSFQVRQSLPVLSELVYFQDFLAKQCPCTRKFLIDVSLSCSHRISVADHFFAYQYATCWEDILPFRTHGIWTLPFIRSRTYKMYFTVKSTNNRRLKLDYFY